MSLHEKIRKNKQNNSIQKDIKKIKLGLREQNRGHPDTLIRNLKSAADSYLTSHRPSRQAEFLRKFGNSHNSKIENF